MPHPLKSLFLLESARREEMCPTSSASLRGGPGSVPEGHPGRPLGPRDTRMALTVVYKIIYTEEFLSSP